jgi:hypothetical protein
MNKYIIHKQDVLHKHPFIFSHLLWTNGVATVYALDESDTEITTTQCYTVRDPVFCKETNVFLTIPKHLCHPA